MTERDKIELKILEDILDDVQGMHGDYIVEYIKDQIDICKNGI
tara:strand:- start:55 stop:183 length:129 start_codon:yes stop_codon:yes gene_type:complete